MRGWVARRESACVRASVAVEHATALVGRLGMALTEVTVAAAIVIGAIVVGHDLREWRTWYHGRPDYYEPPPAAPAATEP
jgi:hypothetical protein